MKKIILSVTLIIGMIGMTSVHATDSAGRDIPYISISQQDDGFVDVAAEALNAKVQAAIQELAKEYEITSLKYNAEKKLTKVEATKRSDQSKKVLLLDDEGKEAVCDAAKKSEAKQESDQAPVSELSEVFQDDGFADVKLEELNEKVQNAVRAIAEKYDLSSLQYQAEKKVTRVRGISKEDQSQKEFYLDEEGNEIKGEAAPEGKTEKTEDVQKAPLF